MDPEIPELIQGLKMTIEEENWYLRTEFQYQSERIQKMMVKMKRMEEQLLDCKCNEVIDLTDE